MRVLHVLAERGFSGGEVQLRHLIEHLQAVGHHNHLALAPGARFGECAAELGLPVFEVDLRRPWSPAAKQALRRAVGSVQPDVLHFGCGRSLLWGGWFARRMQVPLKITTRRIDYPIGRGRFRGGRYRRLVHHVVANCQSVRRCVLAAGVPPERVTLVHEGIEMAPWDNLAVRRAAARAELGLAEGALVLSCAATLRPRKGQRALIHAFAALAARFPEAVLVLAGEGGDRARLAALAVQLGVADRVRLPGRVQPVADLYAASDLSCMPSYHEGLSNACLEASAGGLPLVVSNVGGLPEIVDHGVTGLVVAPGDVDGLSRALIHYLESPTLRHRAGVAGAARTRRLFTVRRMAERMEALFTQLLATPR